MGEKRSSGSSAWPDLIAKARSGCDQALGEIFESVHSYLLLVAESQHSSRVRSKFGASDIIQRSMLEAQQSIGDFRGSSEAEMRQWLKRIVVNNLTDEVRRYTNTHARNVDLELPDDTLAHCKENTGEASPSWQIRKDELDHELAAAVAKLSSRQRFVIEARHRDGRDYADIAKQLGISEAGVRKIWSRATQQLRELLESPQ